MSDPADPVILYRSRYSSTSMEAVVNDEEKREKCRGIRVFYYSPGGDLCDHIERHKGGWRNETQNKVEEGSERKEVKQKEVKVGRELKEEKEAKENKEKAKEEKVVKEEEELKEKKEAKVEIHVKDEKKMKEEKILKESKVKGENHEKLLKVEAGTVIDIVRYQVKHNTYDKISEARFGVVVKWDCGFIAIYNESNLASIRVFDLGPTGMLLLSWLLFCCCCCCSQYVN